jgi:hypothetical protein
MTSRQFLTNADAGQDSAVYRAMVVRTSASK